MRRMLAAMSVVASLAMGLVAQQTATASASFQDQLEVSVGTFLFSPGEKLALEIVRAEPCPCLCEPIEVVGFRVLDAGGELVYQDLVTPYPRPLSEWVGRWALVDSAETPVGPGDYTCEVLTSLGKFRAQVRVVAAGEPVGAGRSLASASVCGLSLRVYRLVEEAEEASLVSLQRGEFLLVALEGNPTTGFEWAPQEVPAFLRSLEGVGYLPREGLIGAGGYFYFRFAAEEAGQGVHSFAYHRAWEEGPPAETFSITVQVR